MLFKTQKIYNFSLFTLIAVVITSVVIYLVFCAAPVGKVVKIKSKKHNEIVTEIKCDIYKNVSKIKFGQSELDEVIKFFGKPEDYVAGNQKFIKSDLPSWYIAEYEYGFKVVIYNKKVFELRFDNNNIVEYKKIGIGTDFQQVFKVLGKPDKELNDNGVSYFESGVLYNNVNGYPNSNYYSRLEKGVRMFFLNGKVSSIYFLEPE